MGLVQAGLALHAMAMVRSAEAACEWQRAGARSLHQLRGAVSRARRACEVGGATGDSPGTRINSNIKRRRHVGGMRIHGLKKVKYHRSAIITMRSILPRTQLIRTALVSSEQSLRRHGPQQQHATAQQDSPQTARRHVTSQDTARVSRHAQSRHTTDHTMSSCFIYTRPSPHPSAPAPTPAAALRCPVGTAPSCSQLPGLRTRCEADMLASTANAIARAAGVRTQASSAAGAEVRGASA